MNMQMLILMGRATKDAEVLSSKGGKKYARFSLAVNEYYGKEEKKEEKTQFFNILVFNKSSENANLIKKGDMVLLDGKPEAEAYLSKAGEPKASLVVYANRWQLMK